MSKSPKPEWLLKAEAKTLKASDKCLSHSEALDKVAAKYGYINWSVLQKKRKQSEQSYIAKWKAITCGDAYDVEILRQLNEIWIHCATDSKPYLETKEWLDYFVTTSGAGVHLGKSMNEAYYDGIFNVSNSWVREYWSKHNKVIDVAYHAYMAALDDKYISAQTEEEVLDIGDEATYLIDKFSHFHDIINQPEVLDVKPIFI